MSNTGIVNIRGKEYKTVAKRVADFRANPDYDGYQLITEIIDAGENVLVKASVLSVDGTIVATGHAEEVRGSSNINATSALENAETSAVGRCLAFTDGDLAGTEIASGDEVVNAISQQAVQDAVNKHLRHMQAVKDNFESVYAIKSALSAQEYGYAVEAYYELSEEDQIALALAPTKGGIWSVEEYKVFKSNEWSAARKAHFGGNNE